MKPLLFQAIDIWMGTCTAFVFAALVEFTFVNHTWRTKGRLPGIPTGLENRADYREMSQSNGNGDQNKNLLNLEEVNKIQCILKLAKKELFKLCYVKLI